MEQRQLGSTDLSVSEIGLGTWEIGGDWGDVSDQAAIDAVGTALDVGIDFLDTADVYGDGRSEQLISRVFESDTRYDRNNIIIATKAGRRLDPHTPAGYTRENLEGFVDRSRSNLGMETLDIVQLHCPPSEVYYRPEVFEALEALKAAGKIAHAGVSVETVEEALKAIEYPVVETVQIIFNPFRQRPKELLFEEATKRDVGIIVRVPLASGLLADKFDEDTEFASDDHRNFNRDGSAFDRGETFAGLPFEEALEAVRDLREVVPTEMSMAQLSLRWILDHEAVSTVIPGSTSRDHIHANVAASEFDSLTHETRGAVRDIYEASVYDSVHHRW